VGGRATPAVIQDLAWISYLHETKTPDADWFELAVMHHTDCGSGFFADDGLRHGFAACGFDDAELAGLAVLDPAATVPVDVEKIINAPQVSSKIRVSGYSYDVKTGLVTTVRRAAAVLPGPLTRAASRRPSPSPAPREPRYQNEYGYIRSVIPAPYRAWVPKLGRMAEHLELPRPLRLVRTAAWSLGESAGLPIGALAIAAWLGGRDIGILTGLGVTCVIAAIRKFRTGTVPGLLAISVMLLTVQTIVVLATGSLWIFLLHFPVANLCLCALFARSAFGPNPLCARLAAEMIALRQPTTHQPGLHRFFQRATVLWAVIFLLLAASLAILLATEPTATFILLSSLATISFVAAGTGASIVWFLTVLRRHGLRLRFAPS